MSMNPLQFTCVLLFLAVIHAAAPSSHAVLDSSRDTAAEPTASSLPTRVIFDHDGGVDDFITLMLLLSQPSKVEVVVSSSRQTQSGSAPLQGSSSSSPSSNKHASRLTSAPDKQQLV